MKGQTESYESSYLFSFIMLQRGPFSGWTYSYKREGLPWLKYREGSEKLLLKGPLTNLVQTYKERVVEEGKERGVG